MNEKNELAQIIPLRRGEQYDTEALTPEELTDDEITDLALSQWRHPAIPASQMGEHIARLHMPSQDDSWSERLKGAIANIDISEDLYHTLVTQHLVFRDMLRFLQTTQSRSDQEKLAHERRATRHLMDMYGLASSDTNPLDTSSVAHVFEKLVKGLHESSHAS